MVASKVDHCSSFNLRIVSQRSECLQRRIGLLKKALFQPKYKLGAIENGDVAFQSASAILSDKEPNCH